MEELINIIDDFNLPPKKEFILTEQDELELFESACLLVEELIRKNPMAYIQPNFHETVANDVFEMLIQSFDENTSIIEEESQEDFADKYEELEHFIMSVVESAMSLFYKHVAPRRSHKTSFVRKTIIKNTAKLDEQILYLRTVPQPEQRTAEWYAFRYKYLTASNIWKAFISQSTKNQLICEKCKPLPEINENIKEVVVVNTESPMHWGNKYEPVSVILYEQMYSTSVSEFGCIPHKTIPFLAASPDGINTDKSSGRFGRMLEVKNIVNREINGNPKMEYWIQMQMQLEVCDLKECDFLETRFTEYADEDAFLLDSKEESTPFTSIDEKYKGIILYFNDNGKPLYEYYVPVDHDDNKPATPLSAYQEWEETMMSKHAEIMWVKTIYWKLAEFSCVLVMRNKLWFASALDDIYAIWNTIEKERKEGYAHRLPTKRTTSINKNKFIANDTDLQTKICYINMGALNNDD